MTSQPQSGTLIYFGPFSFDRALGKLSKHGTQIRLRGMPLKILQHLVERPGEAVSRGELQSLLWNGAAFGDFEQGLNSAVNIVRRTLSDSADQPHYIETVPGNGYRRTQRAQTAARDAGLPKNVSPATQAGGEFSKNIPDGTAPFARKGLTELQPPPTSIQEKEKGVGACGSNPQTGQLYRFNPQTGQPCDGLPQERVVVRQAPAHVQASPPPITLHEPTAEEKRLAAAYAREQEARLAPTSIRASSSTSDLASSIPAGRSGPDDLAQVAALTKAVGGRTAQASAIDGDSRSPQAESEYEGQNMQTRKEAFLNAARTRQRDDYLTAARTAPLSVFEIKAGWEIPAVLEQNLNSDLPGELKALVMASVYDTASGRYLLIPQGSRLVGKYDSRIAYGQDGVQVAWNRIIFPDASSIDLSGMVGLDSHGNGGLRDKVDRHYARIIGFRR
jgi:type IV secretory pathway VirB10-like protein/DNA-binding winged helix-turn-helix (wHTH) protein